MSGGKESWYLPYIFGSSDIVGKIIIKIIINTTTQIRDKTAIFFIYLGFLSGAFTVHRSAGEWGG